MRCQEIALKKSYQFYTSATMNRSPDQNAPNYDRMYRLMPLIEHFRKSFKEVITLETCQAIDKTMFPFKGKHRAKMYMPKNIV